MRHVSLMCGHLDGGEMGARREKGEEEGGGGAYLEALGLKTLHMGQVLVACWREPTA